MGKPTEYKRMMEFGAWLEKFITVPLNAFNIVDQFDDAIRLLKIDYVRREDDPVIAALMLAFMKPEWMEKYKDPEDKSGVWGIPTEVYSEEDLKSIRREIISTILYPKSLIHAIRLLDQAGDEPWEYVLSKQFNEDAEPRSLASILNGSTLSTLLSDYNKIQEQAIVRDRKIVVVNRFVPDSTSHNIWGRMPALASRIFINFLSLGGDEYSGLCKNIECKKFILAERKGQRQYCSGKCRIASKRKRDKAKKVIKKIKQAK